MKRRPRFRTWYRHYRTGKIMWARIEALQGNKAFLEAHEQARLLFEGGKHDAVFPLGTYLMVQRFGVAVDDAQR